MYPLKFHAGLTLEKWRTFTGQQQVLMIGTEISRAVHWIRKGDAREVDGCYERAFELCDLTCALAPATVRLRELRRIREALAGQYLCADKDPALNQRLLQELMDLSKSPR